MDIFGWIGDLLNFFLITPLINLFVLLTTVTGNAGIAVILLTIIIRIITFPLTVKQMHSTRMMAAMQPRMQEIQKKYKDPRRRSQEQMKLYREAGINPLGCISSMLLQFPILIALYRTFVLAVGEAPEALLELSGRLYDIPYLRTGLPLPADFLWLHLGRPDPFILPLLVAMTTYLLQKMSTMPAMDERARAQAQMMNFLMPLIFGYITITLPSGLGLYYVLSNIIGIAMQYLYVGGGPINWRAIVGLSQEPVLPRAMELRQKNIDRVKNFPRSDDEDELEEGEEPKAGAAVAPRNPNRPDTTGTGGGKRRRRRYNRGQR
jgi:YidC/Oxa1 family membrane protein insertase